MTKLDALEALDAGESIVGKDMERRLIVVWNGSQTFNVYLVDENGWWNSVDCFCAQLDYGGGKRAIEYASERAASYLAAAK
jgi:hypothetical protein